MGEFNVPVVIIIFKRRKILQIINKIAQVKPSKLYIIGDHGRNAEEKEAVEALRRDVENAITWDCEVIKNYADENRGVYAQIGEGAKWVFSKEERAIFLEDDNLPEITFFEYCRQLLEYYKDDPKILWICGTNYLTEYKPQNGASYIFTKHVHPCGWASWSDKFLKYYDGNLNGCADKKLVKRLKREYLSKNFYIQHRDDWLSEYRKIKQGKRPRSWDHQMDFSIKANHLYGIVPYRNQIKNIGVDCDSIHGGTDFNNVMTQRICGMDSLPLEFPLTHSDKVETDEKYEQSITEIVLLPRKTLIRLRIARPIKRFFKVEEEESLKKKVLQKFCIKY
ncbi:MAG: hemolytic protein HlpA [Clostridiales bacterium]|nr:MAG: hemolytic protein HlpA [Clostridiales bacterium]